jgi:hypothetical protein
MLGGGTRSGRANCQVCMRGPDARNINKHLLCGTPMTVLSRASKIPVEALARHLHNHLPWRKPNFRKAVTIGEQLEDIKFELSRLQILGECGDNVTGAIAALRERRSVLELEARLGGEMDTSHKKMILNNQRPEGDFEVVFVNGRPKTVPLVDKKKADA